MFEKETSYYKNHVYKVANVVKPLVYKSSDTGEPYTTILNMRKKKIFTNTPQFAYLTYADAEEHAKPGQVILQCKTDYVMSPPKFVFAHVEKVSFMDLRQFWAAHKNKLVKFDTEPFEMKAVEIGTILCFGNLGVVAVMAGSGRIP